MFIFLIIRTRVPRMILEHMRRSGIETTMREHLAPDNLRLDLGKFGELARLEFRSVGDWLKSVPG